MKPSLAIAYAMKKKAHMAHGGMMEHKACDAHGLEMCEMCHGGKMAEGGYVHEEEESGYEPMPHEHKDHEYPHAVENQHDQEDMVGRIMRHRFSKGGEVANATPVTADFEDNEFDDLVKDDGLDEHYTAKNSGDELGNKEEDEDRHDIVSRAMKSRRLKDRMPRPA